MYTADEVSALRERMEREGRSRAETVKALAWACLGWPYVFGAWGAMCTPQERRARAGYRPDAHENIYKACPVLSGKQDTCAGCKWQGTRCFDCRGFTHWLLAQAGLDLTGGGATTQYETGSNWAIKGEIKDMPEGLVCCVFKRRNSVMSHTGMHVGGGEIVHCSTVVKTGSLNDTPAWTHYGIPAGLYTDDELRKAGVKVENSKNIPTLRKGAEGDLVKRLQELLNLALGAGLNVDGKFGPKTEDAVKVFQAANGLKADGIVGPKTWEALGGPPEDEAPDSPDAPGDDLVPDDPPAQEPHPPDGDAVSVSREMLDTWAALFEEAAREMRDYLGQG